MIALPRNRILVGDAADHLRRLPAASVDTVVTSPPYFALRNYQVDGQLGQEATVHEWVANLLPVLDEAARLLKPEGSLWLNVGDSYSRHLTYGALPKSFVLGPERLLLALVERGWVVRNKVVWAKPNYMPASVADRLTPAWEPLFLLVRSRRYYFDLDAIRVPHASSPQRRPTGRRRRGPGNRGPEPKRPPWAGRLAGSQSGLPRLKQAGLVGHPLGKNPGDVWTIAPSNVRGGIHRAMFPEALVERPLLAACPERTCEACGLAWRRKRLVTSLGSLAVRGELRPSCSCDAGWRPGVVLDPFIGSGTTALVAERLGRDWLGIELNPAFAAAAEHRITAARDNRAGRGP